MKRSTVCSFAFTLAASALLVGACGSSDLVAIEGPPPSTGADDGGGSSGSSGASGTSGGPAVDGGDGSAAPVRKRGLAYGYNSDDDLAALSAGIGWWYNWAAKPDDTLAKGYAGLGVEFVPMIWGKSFDAATLDKQVPKDAKYLLTFNEPNFGAQSNITPAEAATMWPSIESFANARNLEIVSPAVNYCGGNCNETDPFVWLQKFFAACAGCRVDHVAVHWYACDKSALVSTLAKYKQFGKPLWLTEFACLDDKSKVNDADELAYMTDAVAALEADPMVFRYAWFTGRHPADPPISVLGTASGTLTPLGQAYLSLPR